MRVGSYQASKPKIAKDYYQSSQQILMNVSKFIIITNLFIQINIVKIQNMYGCYIINFQVSQPLMKIIRNNVKLYSKYYRKADPIKKFGQIQYDLRFQKIKNSFLNQNALSILYSLLKWKTGYTKLSNPTDRAKLDQQMPMTSPNFKTSEDQLKLTWIGHSTATVSFGNDATFLIDPVFSGRASMFQWIGPKRYRQPACSIKQLPQIHAVLISHDHYDHLDTASIKQIHHKFPDTTFYTGLGASDMFPNKSRYQLLDWTETRELVINSKVFKITFIPVCHWGSRGLLDFNKRLWGGFIIQAPNSRKVFYCGDTGYVDMFKEIGEIFQGFDLALIPIGAYHPYQFLGHQHINPAEAVLIHKDIRSKQSIGVHWGTFPLGYQHYLAPKKDLQTAKRQHKLNQQQFLALNHGESFSVKY